MSSGRTPKDKHSPRRVVRGFQFKQFIIHDDRCAHKVGTDGTLLGAWLNLQHAENLLDIGTGSGLIALMLAQRSAENVCIEGVELTLSDYSQAKENVQQSPWSKKITLHHVAIQQFQSDKKFDCIASNPPYFNKSFKPPDESRIVPRHTETLSFEDLLIHSKRLLSTTGTLNVILPYTEGQQFIELAKSHGFFLSRQWSFRTREAKTIERWLLEFSLQPVSCETGEILLYREGDEWSDGYKQLTKPFYLKH